MYPVFRIAKEWFVHKNAPDLAPHETHISHHICWPWDIDLWMELNNGRTLTLFDLGRVMMMKRLGVIKVMSEKKWGGAVAGASVRYRKRVRMFDRLEMRSRLIGWDDKFSYIEQSLWRGETCCCHGLMRIAVTDKSGLVRAPRLAEAMGHYTSPTLPDWVQAWIAAEDQRPWPPMSDAVSGE